MNIIQTNLSPKWNSQCSQQPIFAAYKFSFSVCVNVFVLKIEKMYITEEY